jgi:CysZ protein
MNGNPALGIRYFFTGLKLLFSDGIRPYFFAPFALNILLFGGLIYLSVQQVNAWIDGILGFIPGWLDFLNWLLWPLFILLLLVIVMYSFTLIANLIASPFNALLAEKVEQKLTGQTNVTPIDWQALVVLIPKSIGRELIKLAYYLPLTLLLVIMMFIPVINIMAPLLWFLFGCWMMAVQYCDYPADNNNISFTDLKKALRKNRLTGIGFGAISTATTMIPLVNLVAMPAAVCGATVFWVSQLENQLPEKSAPAHGK